MIEVIESWDDNTQLEFWGYAGGGSAGGLLSTITLAHRKSDGSAEVLHYALIKREPAVQPEK
jgi:hypothetical protein